MWFLKKKGNEEEVLEEKIKTVKEEKAKELDELKKIVNSEPVDEGLDFLEDDEPEKKVRALDDRIDEVVNLVRQRELAYKNGDMDRSNSLSKVISDLLAFNSILAEESVSVLNESISEDFSEDELEEYIWVDGFKGTDMNIECRGHRFEVGKVSKIDGDIEMCKNGFHFCTELKEVMNYYSIVTNYGEYTKNRFFKVRAKVKRRDYLLSKGEYKLKHTDSAMLRGVRHRRYEPNLFLIVKVKPDKLVTGEIEFVEEVGYNELESMIKSYGILSKRIKNESDWELLKKVGNISEFDRKEFEESMKKLGFSDGVIVALYKKINSNIRTEFKLDRIREIVEYVGGLVDMSVSTDMLVFLTIEKINECIAIEKSNEYGQRGRF